MLHRKREAPGRTFRVRTLDTVVVLLAGLGVEHPLALDRQNAVLDSQVKSSFLKPGSSAVKFSVSLCLAMSMGEPGRRNLVLAPCVRKPSLKYRSSDSGSSGVVAGEIPSD